MKTEQEIREQIADEIIAELVCCDIYDKVNALPPNWRGSLRKHFGREYHDICHWGGYAAAIARGKNYEK